MSAQSLGLAALLAVPLAARAQSSAPLLPPHFTFETLAAGLPRTVDFLVLPGGRLLTAEQSGRVRALEPDGTSIGIVLDLTAEVAHHYDRGLMSIAVHPGFAPDGGPQSWLYLYYAAGPDEPNGTDDVAAIGRLARYRVQGGSGGLEAVLDSRQVLLGNLLPDGTCPDGVPILHESHMGAQLAFGADGTLLLATGDGSDWLQVDTGGLQPWAFDDYTSPIHGKKGPWSKVEDSGSFRAKDVRSLAGKVLRIDPATGLGLPSNPFFDGDPASRPSRVWALGLRNPFRMTRVPGTGSASPALGQPGWMIVADVGAKTYEEVNVVRGGEDFGWPCTEGLATLPEYATYVPPPNPYGWATCSTSQGTPTPPALAYPRLPSQPLHPAGVHQDLSGQPLPGFLGVCVIGGVVYDGTSWPLAYHGRYLFNEHGYGWAKALALDASGDAASVVDLGEQLHGAIGWRMEPSSGDVLVLRLESGELTSTIQRIGYGSNAPPFVAFDFAPLSPSTPLTFAFDASATSDPDGDPLVYTWDFGDGTHGSGVTVTHTFPAPGVFAVQLAVDDGLGTVGSAIEPVVAGFTEPLVQILSPAQGAAFAPNETLLLSGLGTDGEGELLHLEWHADLFLDGTWVPDVFVLHGPTAQLPFVDFGDPALDYGYRLRLLGFDGDTEVADAAVTIHPQARVVDVTGPAEFVAKVLELAPPGSQGFGNPDPEVLRDLEFGAPGAPASLQYATYHPASAAAGGHDWLGYRFGAHHPPGARVFAVELQGGQHLAEGGWFEKARVEVLSGGAWTPVQHLVIDPPFGSGPGAEYATRRFAFDAVEAQGVRVVGRAGGTLRFVSATELRVLAVAPPTALRDLTATGAEPIASTLELSPPGPQAFGASTLTRLVDGAEPLPGSASAHAQVSSFHPAASGPAWFGVRFEHAVTASAVRFREGLVWDVAGAPVGGWLEDLTVQTRAHAASPWIDVDDAVVSPPYRTVGPGTLDHEAYTIAFAPRALRELRVVGPPGGSAAFATASELRVFGPHAWTSAWTARAGLGLPADGMTLLSTTPPALGMPVLLEAHGGPPNAPAVLAIASAPALVPLAGTLLVDLAHAVFVPFALGPAGSGDAQVVVPPLPGLAGLTLPFQAFALDPAPPGGVRYSNALDGLLGDG